MGAPRTALLLLFPAGFAPAAEPPPASPPVPEGRALRIVPAALAHPDSARAFSSDRAVQGEGSRAAGGPYLTRFAGVVFFGEEGEP